MKKIIFALIIIFTLISCSEKKLGNFNLTGTISGLQKGTIYLEQVEINGSKVIDSIYINNGDENFSFTENIEGPGLLSITIDNSLTKKLFFFGEPGEMNIKTELNKFIFNAVVSGSEQQDILKKHDDYVKDIKFQNLNIIKDRFIAQKNNELNKIETLNTQYKRNIRRLYLFTANYAINNGNQIIGAYIGLTRIDKSNIKLKQQVFDSLSEEVKKSKYGMLLAIELNTIL